MTFRDPVGQAHYTAAAREWTDAQAARLGVTAEALTAAITRGWLADEIETVSEAAELIGPPPPRDVFGLREVVK